MAFTVEELRAMSIVQSHIEGIRLTTIDWSTTRDYLADAVAGRVIESPLEAIFLMAWDYSREPWHPNEGVRLTEQAEAQVGDDRFRLDFMVWPTDPIVVSLSVLFKCDMRLGVELDGHDFHERTKEQVAYRNRRDRLLQQDGWTILHFSGSELHNEPLPCIASVRTAAKAQMERIRKAVFLAVGLGNPVLIPDQQQ